MTKAATVAQESCEGSALWAGSATRSREAELLAALHALSVGYPM